MGKNNGYRQAGGRRVGALDVLGWPAADISRYRQAGGHGRRKKFQRVGALDVLGAAADIANVIHEERRLRRIESELNKQRGGLHPWKLNPRKVRRMYKQRGGLHSWQHDRIRRISQRGGLNPWKARRMLTM